jgi:hypothetical protein
MYAYVNVMEREISTPRLFSDMDDAKMAMRKDFLKAVGEDVVNELREKENMDITDIDVFVELDSEFGINETSAWANDSFGPNHANWDGQIFEL